MTKTPIIREADGELLGFIGKSPAGWTAETIFGYVFARSAKRDDAEEAVRSQGLNILQGMWQYFDKKDRQWYPCVLKEVFENKVIVIRTNEMGYQVPDTYKRVIITHPTDTNLVKA